MDALAVSLNSDVHAAPPADPTEVFLAEDFNSAVDEQSRRLTLNDLLEEVGECGEFLDAAIRSKNARLIGRMVLAVRDAYVHRLAERELGLKPSGLTARQIAALLTVEHAQ